MKRCNDPITPAGCQLPRCQPTPAAARVASALASAVFFALRLIDAHRRS